MKSPKLKEKAWEILKSVLCYNIKQNIARTEAIDTIVIIFLENLEANFNFDIDCLGKCVLFQNILLVFLSPFFHGQLIFQ